MQTINIFGGECRPMEECTNGKILKLLEKLIMQNAEMYAFVQTLPAAIAAVKAQVEKAQVEIVAQVAALNEALVAGGTVPEAVVTAMDAINAATNSLAVTATALDDMNPDPVVEPAPVEPAPEPVVEEPAPVDPDPVV